MAGFHPFEAQLIRPEFVRRVPAPAFDSMSIVERQAYLDSHPESYTLVTRSPGDGGPEDDATSDRLIELGAQALQRITDSGAFEAVGRETFFLYQLTLEGHSQLGVVGLIDVADYHAGRVKKHEQVADDRAYHLSRHFELLRAQSSPIALGYRHDPALTELLDDVVANLEPVVEFTSGDGLGQAVWIVDDPTLISEISDAVESHELYIMDGHHRAAAAGVLHERVKTDETGRVLAVLFDDRRINIEPFHRRVIVPAHLDLDAVHEALIETLRLAEDPTVVTDVPNWMGGVGVWSQGRWWSGHLPSVESTDPTMTIDPVRLQHHVLQPILGVEPGRSDGHIGYFVESFDRNELTRAAPRRELFFVLRAVTPEQVFAVADAGLNMPPKSTYVIPKPRSGVFLRRFEL